MNDVIALKPAAIILAAVDFNALKPPIEAARAAGIPVMISTGRSPRRCPTSPPSPARSRSAMSPPTEIQRLLTEKNGVGEGQGAAGPGRSRRPLYARHPEGLRGEDEGLPGRQDHLAARPCSGRPIERRHHRRRPAARQSRHRPDLRHAAHLSVAAVASLEAAGKKPGDVMLVSSNGAPVGLDLIRKGWQQVEVEQPLYAQAAALAMFADKVVGKQEIKPGDLRRARAEVRRSPSKPGGRTSRSRARRSPRTMSTTRRFWGNLKPPTDAGEAGRIGDRLDPLRRTGAGPIGPARSPFPRVIRSRS